MKGIGFGVIGKKARTLTLEGKRQTKKTSLRLPFVVPDSHLFTIVCRTDRRG
jgi:hypothetical protein